MAVHDMIIVSVVVGVFLLFGSVLGFASWEEGRRRGRK